jgi:hypothetical protein
MSNSNDVLPVDSTLIQKYAPTIFSAAITVFGGLQVLVSTGHSLVDILQFVALLITTATTFGLRGRWKVGLEVVGVLVVAVLPFAINQQISWPNALLIAVAVVKALATHFGVTIRNDVTIGGGTALPTVAPAPEFGLTAAEIAAGAVDPAKVTSGTITAESIASGAITAQSITSDSQPVDEPGDHVGLVEKPKRSDSTEKWREFADQFHYEDVSKLTRADLIEKYGDR